MKSRTFEKLTEKCKVCRSIRFTEDDKCICACADSTFEWEMMDDALCIRFEFGYSRQLDL